MRDEDHRVKEDSPIELWKGCFCRPIAASAGQRVLGGHIDIACDVSAKLLLQAAPMPSAHVAVLDAGSSSASTAHSDGSLERPQLRNHGIGSGYIAALPKSAGMANLRKNCEVLGGRVLGFRHAYWCPTPRGRATSDAGAPLRSIRGSTSSSRTRRRRLELAEEGLRKLAGELALARCRAASARQGAPTPPARPCGGLARGRADEGLLRTDVGPAGRCRGLAKNLHRAMHDLRPVYLLHAPAVSASSPIPCARSPSVLRSAGMKVHFTTNYAGRPSEGVERVILAILPEALMNIHRHSGSKTARVALRSTEGSLALTITDQGQWREGADGVGLSSMRERVAEVGGALTVRPTRRGTRLFALVPTPN
jgi:hypothetical protein